VPGPSPASLASTPAKPLSTRPSTGASLPTQTRAQAAVAVDAPQANRVAFVAPHAPSALNHTQPLAVPARPPVTQLRLNAQGRDVRPPARVKVTLAHVHGALAAMPGNIAARLGPGALKPPQKLFDTLTEFGSTVDDKSDARFYHGIELAAKGRALLADYYRRKYQASITFNDAIKRRDVTSDLPGLIALYRQEKCDMRRAHYFGESMGHATVMVYIREGTVEGEGGEEALLYFDSGQQESVDLSGRLAKACAELASGKKPVPVFQHARAIQRDWHSCWLYAMKAATTLTGRRPGGDGHHGEFLIPDLIARLKSRATEAPEAPGVFIARALPEMARMAQSEKSILTQAGDELDQPLMGLKNGISLRHFLEKYSYELEDDADGRPHLMLDYMREKGESVATIIEAEDYSAQIQAIVGAAAWGQQQQDLFAAEIKKLVRADRRPLSVDQEIQKLESLANDPAALFIQAAQTAVQMDATTIHLGNGSPLADLLDQLSPAGLDEMVQHLTSAANRLNVVSGTLEKGIASFTDPRKASSWSRAETEAFVRVGMPLASNLGRKLEDVQSDQLLLVLERKRRAKALTDDALLLQRPDMLRVAGAIAQIPDTSIPAFHEAAIKLFAEIDKTRMPLAALGVAGPSLAQMTPAELKELEVDLQSHRVLLERLNKRCNEFLEPLMARRPSSAGATGMSESDVESDEDDFVSTGIPEPDHCQLILAKAHTQRMNALDRDIALVDWELAGRD
jgi:hypothetical protein